MKRFIELQDEINLLVIARPTVTILNIYHLPETLEWLDQHNIRHNATHLTHPTHMSVTVLPLHTKQMILDKFENERFRFCANLKKKVTLYIYIATISKIRF